MRIINQPERSLYLIDSQLNRLKKMIALTACMTLFFLNYSIAQLEPNAMFATFDTPDANFEGTGSFNCDEMPDFLYSISGDVAPGDTSIPGPAQVIDNNGGGFETVYGQADTAENIEVEVAGYTGAVGDPITNTVETTITFLNMPTPAGQLAFLIADVEQDQVQICALDANGVAVPVSTIAGWFQSSFDADNTDAATVAPSWDAATGTLVGQEGPGGVRQTVYQADLPDNEAGAAWFQVDIPITQLTFKSQALGIQPDDPSQHFILVGACNIYDNALTKVVTSPAPYVPGGDVTYDIQVCNQGNIESGVLEITDLIPTGMSLSGADANGWVGPAAGPVTNTTSNLAVGACEIIPIVLTIDPTFQGTSIINNAVISMDNGFDVDSDPAIIAMLDDLADDNDLLETDGGDDEDPEQIVVEQTYDLALIKQATDPPATTFAPGDDVNYTITVCNQGTVDAGGIVVTDNIPAGMTLSGADANGWAGPAAGPVTNAVGGLPVGMCTTLDIVLTIDPTFTGTSIINNAQITADDGDDVDSDPDVFAMPDDLADDDDLTETDGGDDEDPEQIDVVQVYDLALIKEEASAGPYMPGDDVTYTITVANQGTLDGGDITITDYIPAGMTLSGADGNGWAGPAAGPVTNMITAPVAGGTPVTVDIVLTIDAGFTGTSLVNFAEITADDGDDADSTPDAINGNDAGGSPMTPSDDELDGDGTGAPDDAVAATDEDDHDPEEIMIGQTLSIGSTVFADDNDNGIQDAGDAGIPGVTVELVDDATGAVIASVVTDANGDYFFDGLAPGDYIVQIPMPDAVYPISSTPTDTADNGVDGNDNGDQPGGEGTIVQSPVITLAPGTEPVGAAENGPTGGTQDDIQDANGDMTIDFGFVAVYDLALIKEEASAGPYMPGDDVTYTITIVNQGTLDAGDITITDYIPAGMTLSGADGNGWAGAAAGPVTNMITGPTAGGAPVTVDIVLTIDQGFTGTSLVNFAEITADDGDDADSTPDAINGNDAGGSPMTPSDNVVDGDGTGAPDDAVAATDEDDHDPEEIMIGQTLSIGSTVFADDNDNGIQDAGDAGIPGVTVELVDDATGAVIASVVTDANGDYFFDGLAPGDYIVQIPMPDAVYPTSSTPTDTADNGVDGNDNGDQPGGEGTIVQSPVITLAPGTEPVGAAEDGPTGGTQDDVQDSNGDMTVDFGFVAVYDLALIKDASDPVGTTYAPGDDVTYTITVCNQGTIDAANITITDYIPAGMTLSGADANGWVGAGPVTNAIAAIPSNMCTTVDIVLTIDATFAGTSLVNFAEITADDGDDADSTPDAINGNDAGGSPMTPSDGELDGDGTGAPDDGVAATDEDDHDPEEIMIGQTLSIGSTVFADDNDNGIQDAGDAGIPGVTVELVDDATSTVIATVVTDANGDYFFDGLAPGDYIVQIPMPDAVYPTSSTPTDAADNGVDGNDNGDQPGGEGTIVQSPVITLAPGTEPVGAAEDGPTGGAQDDVQDANGDMTVDFGFVAVYDLALIKDASDPVGTTYAPGDDVTYTITVCNQGTIDAANITITDYIPAGMSLSGADANGWVGAGPVTNTIAAIPSNMCTTVDIVLTIDATFAGTSLVNFAEITADDGDDADSTPDAINGNDAGGSPMTPSDGELDGDGTGAPDDGVAATDEDDHDPEEILIGQTLSIGSTVFIDEDDSGTQDAGDAGIPGVTVELVDAATMAVIATVVTDANGDYLFDGLAPGDYIVQIPMPDSVYPISSTPTDTADNGVDGNDNGDQPGGEGTVVQSPVITLAPGTEPVGAAEDGPTGGAQDDLQDANGDMTIDFGFLPRYDLALIKEATDPVGTTYSPGDDVNYTIMVCNQGTVDAANLVITDYIPASMTLSGADANNWAGPAAGPITNTIVGLPAGMCTTLDLILTIDPAFAGGSLINFAEITTDDGDDVDSTPDAINGNDAGGSPMTPSDDVLTGDGTGAPDDAVAATDEDDHDPEEIVVVPCEDIAGVVFLDLNNDGCQLGAAETGVEGVTANLLLCDAAGNPIGTPLSTTTTGTDGSYSFSGTDPATGACILSGGTTYTVQFAIPGTLAGYTFSTGDVCPGTELADDVVPGGTVTTCYDPAGDDDDLHIDAGITPPCEEIGGVVFLDEDNDGCQIGATETGVPGVTANLWVCDAAGLPTGAPVSSTTTGADGTYTFGGTDPLTGACLLDPTLTYTVQFILPGALSDYTYSEGDACPGTANADDVVPGQNYTDCYDPAGADDDDHIDAGIVPPPVPCESIGGVVFEDINDDGCQVGAAEAGLAGVTAMLFTCDASGAPVGAALSTVTTASDGSYSFGGTDPATGACLLDPLETYTVQFAIPGTLAGYTFSTGDACPGTELADDVVPGQTYTDCYDPTGTDDDDHIDAGLFPPPVPCEDIGGVVFLDEDNDGCQIGATETGVPGVTANLWVCDAAGLPTGAPVSSTTTGADGTYTFGGTDPATGACVLDPALTYTVQFILPGALSDYTYSEGDACPGTANADDVVPGENYTDCYDPAGADDDDHIDAGIVPPPVPCESIGGVVFEDVNDDGCQVGAAEAGLAGVTAMLFTCDAAGIPVGAALSMAVTAADGSYSFGGTDPVTGACLLDPALTYTVQFAIPGTLDGYTFSTGDACPGTELADDVVPGQTYTDCYDPAGADDDDHIDAGLVPPPVVPCEDIGGVVFLDEDNDGCQIGATETGVPGVTANLWVCDAAGLPTGAPVSSTTTGADGTYTFGGTDPATGACVLDPALTYTVQFILPGALSDYTYSAGDACPGTANADDVVPGQNYTDCYDPAGADDDDHIDAGIVPPPVPCESIGGVVFEDANDDGCQVGAAETGLAGVTAMLFTCDAAGNPVGTPVGTATTASDGSYSFGGTDPTTGECLLDPTETYTVQFAIPGTLAGYTFSAGDACPGTELADDVVPGETYTDCYDPAGADDDDHIDAGLVPPPVPCESIGGVVFEDANDDGCQMGAAESGVPGVTANLWVCDAAGLPTGAPVSSTTTGADGSYTFGGTDPVTGACVLDPALTYTVQFILPGALSSYTFSAGDTCPGTADANNVVSGQNFTDCYDPTGADDDDDIDAGIVPPPVPCESIGGVVFEDANDDGCQVGAAETGLAGVTAMLFTCDAAGNPVGTPVGTATTASDGSYSFGGTDPATGECLLDPTATYTVQFSIPGTLAGYTFSAGDACPGTELADDVVPGETYTDCYDPTGTDDDEHIDAGLVPPPVPCEDIGGVVFEDANDDGCQMGAAETGVAGVTANLWVCDAAGLPTGAPVSSTTTGADGSYTFGGTDPVTGACVLDPALTYTVQFILPGALSSYTFSAGDTCPGTADANNVVSGQNFTDCYDPTGADDDDDIDAGIVPPPVPCESIGGVVFEDANDDGCQVGAAETGLAGVTAMLFTCDAAGNPVGTPVGTATTASDGSYSFGGTDPTTGECLLDPTATYTVQFAIPGTLAGYTFSAGDACPGTELADDVVPGQTYTDCYDPTGADDDDHVDAGLVPPPVVPCESIGGVVFEDANDDGCQVGAAETGLAGVTAMLFACDAAGTPIGGALSMTTTATDGSYSFGGTDPTTGACLLDPTLTYTVQFAIPGTLTGYTFSAGDACPGTELADDVVPGQTYTDCYDPSGADDDDHIDAGLVPPPVPCEEIGGVVFEDANDDGCQMGAAETGVAGVTANLWVCDAAGLPTGAPVSSTTTGADGSYTFGGTDPVTGACVLDPALTYTVQFILPGALSSYTFSAGDTCPGTADANNVVSGQNFTDCYDPTGADDDDDIDAGIVPPPVPCESIGGVVFEDTNDDGCQVGAAETGLAGVTAMLFTCDAAGNPVGTPVGTATTATDGSYSFGGTDPTTGACLLDPTATYTVQFAIPGTLAGYTFSAGDACPGTELADDVVPGQTYTDCYDPTGADDDDHVDAGLVPPACEDISGVVFNDADGDGCDTGASGVGGVTVDLVDCNSGNANVIASTVTAADGSYMFGPDELGTAMICLVPGGSYSVEISGLPAGYTNSTGPGTGCAGNEDDSPNNDGESICGDPSDPTSDHIDFGIVPPVQTYDLALIKQEISSGPYSPGDDVTYSILVENQGSLDAGVITVVDYIPAGMSLSVNDTNGWTGGPTGNVTNIFSGPTPGNTTTITIVLTIDSNFTGSSLTNNAEIQSDNGDDVDSVPGDNSQPNDTDDNDDFDETDGGDDEDPETILVGQVYDLALMKQVVGNGPFAPGDDVTYVITVMNQGTLNAANIEISDYIPTGMSLSAADANGWTGGPTGTVTNTITSLLVGASATTEIVLTIDSDFIGTSISNNAAITADDGDDTDSDPGVLVLLDDFADNDNVNEIDGGDDEDPELIDVLTPAKCDELVCNGDLQISLNVACMLKLTPDMLLEAPLPGWYEIQLFTHHGDYLRDDYLLAEDAGHTIKYQISCEGNSCWGEIIVEANIVPQFDSPCAITEDGSIPEDCILWCGPEDKVPASLVTPEEVQAAFGNCGPDLLGDVRVTRTTEGDICTEEGEVVTLVYTGKVILHGQVQTVDILTQVYTTLKLDVDENTFNFPKNVTLDCDYLDHIVVEEGEEAIAYEFGEPASILAATGSGSLSYPNYIDIHDTVLNIVTIYDTTLVVIDTMLRDTMIKEIIGGEELWVLKTIVDKVYEEEVTTRLDTIGRTNPVVPIVDRVCNVLSGYSDIEFDACGQGKKIIRTWNLIDWCEADITISARQTIEIKDITPPQIVELVNGKYVPVTMLSDVTASINPYECSATYKLPELTILDNCDENPGIEWDSNEGTVVDGYLTDIWLGQSPVVITGKVIDDCGNYTGVSFNLIVVDDVPPVPVCETALQVSLTGNAGSDYGIAKIYAADLDEGSHDSGCGKVTITAVRMEDWREVIRDCQDNIVGYAPQTCAPVTTSVDLGAPVFKNDCDATGENIAQITAKGDHVKFCCEDLGQIVQVILFIEDEQGNVNQCMVSVEVVDKSAPTLICEDKVISCADGDYLAAPAMIGASCERENPYEVLLLSENRGNNVCAGGQTVREWYVDLDNSGDFTSGDAYCQQIVSVDADTAFDPYTIKWPKNYDGKQLDGINLEVNDEGEVVEIPKTISMGDAAACTPDDIGSGDGANGEGSNGSGGLGLPVWCDTECGLVGYTMEADTIKASDACLKIIRRWTIVDWCTYDPNGSGIDDENDSATDSFQAVEDWAQFEPDAVGCPTFGPNIGDAVYFRYTSVDKDGYYTYDQVIVVNDDTAPEIDGPATYVVNTTGGADSKDDATDCIGEDVITATASDLCGGEMTGSDLLQWQITVSKDGNVVASKTVRGPSASMSSQVGSPGDTHIITWRVKDGCGNATSAQTVVTFGDQQAPTPFCVAGLTTAFMASDGTVAVWGAEFDFGSFDNCTESEDLRFSLVRSGETPIQPGEEGFEAQTGITFDCRELANFDELDVWVWDEIGNGDFCTVGILLSDNGNVCPEEGNGGDNGGEQGGAGLMIAGQVRTSYGMMIDEVEVTAEADGLTEYPVRDMTNANGEYAFENNPQDFNYTLTADKADDYMTGVSTLDLVMISRHIIGSAEFEDPYTILAADASVDGRVSAVDLTTLKRLILGVTEELAKTTPWIFIDASKEFFDAENPWPFTENINIAELSTDMMNEDFIGVKIGDVNQSYQGAESRNTGVLTMNADNETLVAGDVTTVEVTSANFNKVAGYQFTMQHEGLTFTGIDAGILSIDESSVGVKEGMITMSWFDAKAMTTNSDDVLFTLNFEATEAVELKSTLSINSAITKAEAYVGTSLDVYGIDMVFGDDVQTASLNQNTPNPFVSTTAIGFNLPQAADATITVYDIAGKELKVINGNYAKGYNEIIIDSEDLSTNGVLYYKLESGSFVATKKMIVVSK